MGITRLTPHDRPLTSCRLASQLKSSLNPLPHLNEKPEQMLRPIGRPMPRAVVEAGSSAPGLVPQFDRFCVALRTIEQERLQARLDLQVSCPSSSSSDSTDLASTWVRGSAGEDVRAGLLPRHELAGAEGLSAVPQDSHRHLSRPRCRRGLLQRADGADENRPLSAVSSEQDAE